jgi:GH24 family phage-related lysozyme (muramidase)
MKTSDFAVEMIKHHEGVRLKPYRCPALLWTIGVGHVLYPQQAKLKMEERKAFPLNPEHDRQWTEGGIDAIFRSDLTRFETGVLRLCPRAIDSQTQFDALVSFSFNVGLGNLQSSTLRMKYNRGEIEGAADEFLKWVRGGGRILPGLVSRRQDERSIFLGGQ